MNAQKLISSDATLSPLASLLPDLEALYADIHAHPELSMQQTRTSGLAADRLRAAGYEVTTGIGKTGVVGLLRNGDGPTVMLRADMDALPVAEATGLPYASKVKAADREGKTVPVMHACGHDMHVTWLVGVTTLMARARQAWHVGGTDPDRYAKAKAAGRLNEIPTNHNPRFAPVIHPTLETGVEAMVVAARTWLAA